MNDMHSALERLEARLEYQTSRIDGLYAMLEERGVATRPTGVSNRSDALHDELVRIEETPLLRAGHTRPLRRPPSRLRLGSATGV